MAMSRKHDGWDSRVGMRREVTSPQVLRDAWLFVRDLVATFALCWAVGLVVWLLVQAVRG